jgi:S1-C subfamily serine protease
VWQALAAVGLVFLVAAAGALTTVVALGRGDSEPPVDRPPRAASAAEDAEETEPEPSESPDPTPTEYSAEQLASMFGDAVWKVEARGCDAVSTGSAFAIDERTLITNWHVTVIDPAPTLLSRDGSRELRGRVIGWSEQPDVAVIVVDEDLPVTVDFVEATGLSEGQALVGLGYPAPATDFTVTRASIMSFQVVDGQRQAIRADGLLDKGNSGGPVLTSTGNVAGVVTEMADNRGGMQLIPLAYTHDYLRDTIDGILAEPSAVSADCEAAGLRPELPDGWDDWDVAPTGGAWAYGDDRALDGLWDACQAGDWAACDELFYVSPFGSEYEAFGASCGDREWWWGTCEYFMDTTGGGGSSAPSRPSELAGPDGYGDDTGLDRLWDGCKAGDWDACDSLYVQAPFDSRYEEYGATCGDRTSWAGGGCGWEMYVEPETFGDDAGLDRLWDGCKAGDWDACDSLYYEAPLGSRYEAFGSTCGERVGRTDGGCWWEFESDW